MNAPARLAAQITASDPSQSIFVTASAGTGKTTILVNRVLRLLLGTHQTPGALPHKILCITYTKAAAAEMKARIQDKLGAWATMAEPLLQAALDDLIDGRAAPDLLKRARALFGEVLDSSGPRIQTIHSFCQSVLARFPLEADIPPHFKALDERDAAVLLDHCIDTVLQRGTPAALLLIGTLSRAACFAALKDILRQSDLAFDPARLRQLLDLDDNDPSDLADLCSDDFLDRNNLIVAGRAMLQGSAGDIARGTTLLDWLAKDLPARIADFDTYADVFLTKIGTIRQTLATQAVQKIFPPTRDILSGEADRILAIRENIKKRNCFDTTLALWAIAQETSTVYTSEKRRTAQLDFNDLILITRSLLENESNAAWVLYKLDGGIDHILIDEAQDTSPSQWRILAALADEFFAGIGARDDVTRTVFAVGDEKQSIYSFQGAEPAAFLLYRTYFAQKITAAEQKFSIVPLNLSFRSTSPVLQLVDDVFADDAARAGVSSDPIHHAVHRTGMAGRAELWPLIETELNSDPLPSWDIVEQSNISPLQLLADKIAAQIKSWLTHGEILEARDRAVQPGDILILVRRRTGVFVDAMIRALKSRNIAVAGADRLHLLDHIAVQDLMAFLQFLLLPDDDLTLAALLKSPLLGWDDDALYALAQPRADNERLWTALQNASDTQSMTATKYLSHYLSQADWSSPYNMVSSIMLSLCPADTVSGRRAFHARLGADALDPLDEFLTILLNYDIERSDGLQGVLSYLQSANPVIKRDQEAGTSSVVRIMTVHGAKGLQAPIVFLPDTVSVPWASSPANAARIVFDGTMPIMRAAKAERPAALNDLIASHRQMIEEEYKRLGYVAMTRAEDRIYICGARVKKKKKAESDDVPDRMSWYGLSTSAFSRNDTVHTLDDGTLVLSQPQSAPAQNDRSGTAQKPAPLLPDFARSPAPHEYLMAGSITPPHALVALSLLVPPSNYARGILIHRLLQILPDMEPEQRSAAGLHALRALQHDLAETDAYLLIEAALRVIHDDRFHFLFEKPSLSEIDITAQNNSVIAGRIDRLRVTDNEVWIVDYKTDRNPPSAPDKIPEIYRAQLSLYRNILQKIYPAKTIQTAILWTETPDLMIVADEN